MGLFNAIQDPRFNEALIRRLGMKQDAPAPQLAGEIQAGLDLFTAPPEWQYLQSIKLAQGVTNASAVAAKLAGTELWNPLGSGQVVVALGGMIATTANSLAYGSSLGLGVANSGVAKGGFRDTRWVGVPTGMMLTNGDTPSVAATATAALYCTGSTPILWQTPIVLFPGNGFIWQLATVNLAMYGWWLWYERAFLPSELG